MTDVNELYRPVFEQQDRERKMGSSSASRRWDWDFCVLLSAGRIVADGGSIDIDVPGTTLDEALAEANARLDSWANCDHTRCGHADITIILPFDRLVDDDLGGITCPMCEMSVTREAGQPPDELARLMAEACTCLSSD